MNNIVNSVKSFFKKGDTYCTMRLLSIIPAYGFVRKIPIVWDAKVERYDVKSSHQTVNDMLVSEKIIACSLGAILSPWLFFMWVDRDLTNLEVRLRGLPPKDYGCNTDNPRSIADMYTMM